MSLSLPQTDTIAALATSPGEAGIAVIRMSGPLAPLLLEKTFKKSSLNSQKWESHKLYLGKIYHEKDFLDEALAVWMRAPHSFTGEDVVEFHIHGGKLIAWKVLQALYSLGARPAAPGEFSQRAFLNGKIDLIQAEAIADIISASSEKALALAQAQWEHASGPIELLRSRLMELLMQLEASVDFPEEDIEIIDYSKAIDLAKGSLRQIEQWIENYELGRLMRDGVVVALVGKPNVGKSSLMNYLSREEVAIVHEEAGTTRDVLEKRINLRGYSFRFIDTAGIREAEGAVEKIGIEKAKRWIEQADLVLAVFDLSRKWENEDAEILTLASRKRALYFCNKNDLAPKWNPTDVFSSLNLTSSKYIASVSVKASKGLQEIEHLLIDAVDLQIDEKQNFLFLNQVRHKKLLEQASASLKQAIVNLEEKASPEWIVADLYSSVESLGEIIGVVAREDVLDNIFSRFCIGK